MTLSLDISSDFTDLIDNWEPVTVVLKRPTGDVTVEIEKANRAEISVKSQFFSGMTLSRGGLLTWGIPNNELNPAGEGHRIEFEDEIYISGSPVIVFIVKTAALVGLGNSPSFWQCVCQEQG